MYPVVGACLQLSQQNQIANRSKVRRVTALKCHEHMHSLHHAVVGETRENIVKLWYDHF